MNRCVPAPWLLAKNSPLICFRVDRRTIVTNIELVLAQTSGPFLLWAYVLPAASYQPADDVDALPSPYVLSGGVAAGGGDGEVQTLPALQQRWELAAGSRVSLLIAPRSAAREAVRRRLASAILCSKHASRSLKRSSRRSTRAEFPCEGDEVVDLHGVLEVRLAGLSVGLPFLAEEPEWRPLLVRRWFELKSYVHEATIVEQPVTTYGSSALQEEEESFGMRQGDVKEAVAVKVDGSLVKWCDGSIGLMDEVMFFYRTYKPARADKVVRVRRHPQRYSDVIGEIPFGLEVYSFGRRTDKFTGEQYALIYLPDDPSYLPYVKTYGLISCGALWVWGWSKIAGASGLPFLVEVEPSCKLKAAYMIPDERTKYLPLPKGNLFTSARDNKGVRIRKKPSLKSEKIGHLQPNEVKEAIALLSVEKNHVAPSASEVENSNESSNITKNSECFEFVEWKDGGFSLIRNAHDTFLTKVELIKGAEAILPPSPHFELPQSIEGSCNARNDVSTDTFERDRKRFRRDEQSFFLF